MQIKDIKANLKEMGIIFDEVSFISDRVPNLFFAFCKNKAFATRYFLIDDSDMFFCEISKTKFYQLGQEALRGEKIHTN